jgi:outer membrane protein assembly factor BamB
MNAKTGETVWTQRLGRSDLNWSSMCYADGKLYVPNRDSVTFVLEATPEDCKVLAENKLGNDLNRSSLAISDGQIFLRTHKHLYCIEEKAKK